MHNRGRILWSGSVALTIYLNFLWLLIAPKILPLQSNWSYLIDLFNRLVSTPIKDTFDVLILALNNTLGNQVFGKIFIVCVLLMVASYILNLIQSNRDIKKDIKISNDILKTQLEAEHEHKMKTDLEYRKEVENIEQQEKMKQAHSAKSINKMKMLNKKNRILWTVKDWIGGLKR